MTKFTTLEVRAAALLEKIYGCPIRINPIGREPGFYRQPWPGYWSQTAYLAVWQHRDILVDVTGDRDEVIHTFD